MTIYVKSNCQQTYDTVKETVYFEQLNFAQFFLLQQILSDLEARKKNILLKSCGYAFHHSFERKKEKNQNFRNILKMTPTFITTSLFRHRLFTCLDR